MMLGKREAKTKAKQGAPDELAHLVGRIFTKGDGGRVFTLTFSHDKYLQGWVLCGAWGGYKGYNPYSIERGKRLVGFENDDLLNDANYYHHTPLHTKAKTEEALLNVIKTFGFIPVTAEEAKNLSIYA